jgi:hypothetical protein
MALHIIVATQKILYLDRSWKITKNNTLNLTVARIPQNQSPYIVICVLIFKCHSQMPEHYQISKIY